MKKTKIALLISELLVFGLLALILFVTIPDARLSEKAFWIAFAFAIPLNFLSVAAFTAWGFGKSAMEAIHQPPALAFSGVFAFIYLVVGAIFMYFNIVKLTFLIVLLSIITVIYIIAALYFVLGTNYIADNQKEVKSKVMFIKLLELDVKNCISYAKNPEQINALTTLADKVRFSDPMSHPSLAGIESDIVTTVNRISAMLAENAEADISALISTATAQLENRNSRCIILK